MKKIILALLCISGMIISINTITGTQFSGEVAYGIDDYNDKTYSIVQTSDGGCIMCGIYRGVVGMVMKLNNTGSVVWSKTYGDLCPELFSVCISSEGGTEYCIVSGRYNTPTGYDGLVMKLYSSNGTVVWARSYGTPDVKKTAKNDYIYSIKKTADGLNYITTGYSNLGSGLTTDNQILIMKLGLDGSRVWANTYGGTSSDQGYSIVQDGNYYVVSGLQGTMNHLIMKVNASDGSVVFSKGITSFSGVFSCVIVDGTNYVIAGDYGGSRAFVCKMPSTGASITWRKGYNGDHAAMSVSKTSDGYYIVSGYYYVGASNDDVLAWKLDGSGNHVWGYRIGGTSASGTAHDWGYSVIEGSDGSYIIGGTTQAYGTGPVGNAIDCYIVRICSDGTIPECNNVVALAAPVTPTMSLGSELSLTPTAQTYGAVLSVTTNDVSLTQTDICGSPFATEMVGFTANVEAGVIELNWKTEVEKDKYKWLIQRAINENGNYEQIAELPAKGGGPNNYTYLDSTIIPGLTYWYKLGDMDINNKITWYAPISATARHEVEFPLSMKLKSINPGKDGANIDYSVPGQKSSEIKYVSIVIYNSSGQIVKILINEKQKPGSYKAFWDGKDSHDNLVSSGSYFVRLKTNGKLSWKLIRIK